MQNRKEQIFDDFIRGKLEATTPDMALLDSYFNTFLLERREKKKKRRWFFWVFLFLLVFVIPFGYYIISTQSNLPKSNEGINEVNIATDSISNSNSQNTEIDEQEKATDLAFVKRNKISTSIQPDSTEVFTTKNIDKLQQSNFNSQPDYIQHNNEHIKTTSADSAISSANVSQNSTYNKIDSALKKKDRIAPKVDTFYIVW